PSLRSKGGKARTQPSPCHPEPRTLGANSRVQAGRVSGAKDLLPLPHPPAPQCHPERTRPRTLLSSGTVSEGSAFPLQVRTLPCVSADSQTLGNSPRTNDRPSHTSQRQAISITVRTS